MDTFSRQDTRVLKGAAILLMLFHHLAAFPERLPTGFAGFASQWAGLLQPLAAAAKLCVPLFFFLGGYGLCRRCQEGTFRLFDTVLRLYGRYWRIFVVLVPVAFALFARPFEGADLLCQRYAAMDVKTALGAVLGDACGYSCALNAEWWFFSAYLVALFWGYLFWRAMRRCRSLYAELLAVVGIDVLVRGVFPALMQTAAFANLQGVLTYTRFFAVSTYTTTFFEGVVFAKYDCLAALDGRLRRCPCPAAVGLVGCAALYWCRAFVAGGGADLFYVPLLCVCLRCFLLKTRIFLRPLELLGRHSVNIWLLHTFYCYYFFEVTRLVYGTRSVLVDLLVLTALSLGSSLLLEAFWRLLGGAFARLRARGGAGAAA